MRQATQLQPVKQAPAFRLRELGIYRLADGREFIVSTLYNDGCCLYARHAWDTFGSAEYRRELAKVLVRRAIEEAMG